jgi:hypothetical protein
MGSQASAVKVTTIRPACRRPGINFREIWDYRELLFILAWRDVAVHPGY